MSGMPPGMPPPGGGIRQSLQQGMAQQQAPGDIGKSLDIAIKILTGLKMAIQTNPQVAQQITQMLSAPPQGGPPQQPRPPMPPPGMPPQ